MSETNIKLIENLAKIIYTYDKGMEIDDLLEYYKSVDMEPELTRFDEVSEWYQKESVFIAKKIVEYLVSGKMDPRI